MEWSSFYWAERLGIKPLNRKFKETNLYFVTRNHQSESTVIKRLKKEKEMFPPWFRDNFWRYFLFFLIPRYLQLYCPRYRKPQEHLSHIIFCLRNTSKLFSTQLPKFALLVQALHFDQNNLFVPVLIIVFRRIWKLISYAKN